MDIIYPKDMILVIRVVCYMSYSGLLVVPSECQAHELCIKFWTLGSPFIMLTILMLCYSLDSSFVVMPKIDALFITFWTLIVLS